ncbi:ATP-binding protein, partial [Roseomonas sp. BU-1]|nr:ATP-binding protein [Falsiroseomonas selenitidurans]
LLAQLAQHRPAPAAAAPAAPPSAEALAARRRALDAVLRRVLAEPDAPFRPAAVLYQDFLVRCRIEEVPGPAIEIPEFRRLLTTARAGIGAEAAAADEGWLQAAARAMALPEDVQGVFLLLARMAREGQPCPSDATLARAYGSRSIGRARRLLTYMEEQGALVVRAERGGRRSIVLVGLAWETAPGDPNGPEEVVTAAA